MGEWMDGYLERMAALDLEAQRGGGNERVAVQHSLGKLTARERIEKLVDRGSFREFGAYVKDPAVPLGPEPKPSPGDGVVMGMAEVGGRRSMVYATDFTVMSGTIGDQGVWKIAELVQMAGQEQVPLFGMIDSAGSRFGFKNGGAGLNGMGRLIRNYCLYSGVIPQITMILGPCTGPMAQIATLSDILIMNERTGFLWLGGEMRSEEAGTADFHMARAGQCDLVAGSDEEAIDLAQKVFAFVPQNCWDKPPAVASTDDPERREERLLHVMPDNPRFTYDMHEIIDLIVDDGEFFELKAGFAPNLIIGFARFGGIATGIAASNPDELSGVMEPDSSDKYDKFMMFLDAFDIPLLTLSDTTAYPPGDKWERMGVIRHGAKNLHGYSNLTNPKVTVVLRRSYGGSNITMGCSKMGPDFIFGWPTVEFAPTGPESIVQAIFHKELEAARKQGRYEEVYQGYLAPLKESFSVLNMAKEYTSLYTVHAVIHPRDTRANIVRALRAAMNKRESTLPRRRYVKPA
jgi:acetyl-CoA carboxylase carboxyltransferase component